MTEPKVPKRKARLVNRWGVDMTDWPIARSDERTCPHGIGHPTPERKHHGGGIHGCDGCCTGRTLPKEDRT